MSNEIRIQKALSDAGLMSRRAAEQMIEAGRIQVNGRPCKLGQKIEPGRDVVFLDGEKLDLAPGGGRRYIALNKPRGYLTAMKDDRGRRCVTDLIADIPERVYPVGRLDLGSEGLLLLTNDGEFANRVMHPAHRITKTYRVTVGEDFTDAKLDRLLSGVEIDGRISKPVRIAVIKREPERSVLEIVLDEGRNRQIRKMCEAAGVSVLRLKRTEIGPVRLGMLAPGKWRSLTPDEIRKLSGEREMRNG